MLEMRENAVTLRKLSVGTSQLRGCVPKREHCV